VTTATKLIGTPINPPKFCRKRGCKLAKAGGDLYHVSREGHLHRSSSAPEAMHWQRDVVEWARSVHGIMGWL
jgi:hypothetical protein